MLTALLLVLSYALLLALTFVFLQGVYRDDDEEMFGDGHDER